MNLILYYVKCTGLTGNFSLTLGINISEGWMVSTSEYATEIRFGLPSGCNQLQLCIDTQPSKRNILFLQTYYIIRDLTHN